MPLTRDLSKQHGVPCFFPKMNQNWSCSEMFQCDTEGTCAHYHNHTPAHTHTHQVISVLPSHLSSVHNNMQKTLQFSSGISVTVTAELLQPKEEEERKWKVGSGYIPKRMSASPTLLQLCILLLLSHTHAHMVGGHAGRAVLRLTAEGNLLADNGQRWKAIGRTAWLWLPLLSLSHSILSLYLHCTPEKGGCRRT